MTDTPISLRGISPLRRRKTEDMTICLTPLVLSYPARRSP